MTRVERIGDATLYLGDCREIDLPREGAAIVSDPPYGMAYDLDSTRFSGGQAENNRRPGDGQSNWPTVAGDDEPFDPSPWLVWPECILFGANHFAQRLPVGTTLVWLKKAPHLFGTFLSDAEIAWMKGGHGVYCFYKPFAPVSRVSEYDGKSAAHPFQKSTDLMAWCIERTKAQTIVDPYMGSASTGVAALNLGRKFVGAEVDPTYFATACRRIEQVYRQPRLFAELAPRPVQQALGGLTASAEPAP